MRIKIFALVILVPLLLAGCRIGTESQFYDYQVTEQDGVTVEINGVRYVTTPETKWEGQEIGDLFGYAGQERKELYLVESDDARDFLFIYDSALCPSGDTHKVLLHREGLSNPSSENIDYLHWVEYKNKNRELEYSYDNIVTDKSIIIELFNEWETKEKIRDGSFFEQENTQLIMYISCYSNDLKGAYYDIQIKHYNGDIVCGNNLEGYVYVSVHLLEKIAGHKILVEEYI